MKRLVVKAKDWYTNIGVTKVEKVGCVIFAYRDGEFVAMIDLGSVDVVYVSEERE